MKRKLLILLAGLFVLNARVHACSVCFVTTDASRYAYYATTVLLSFLPLAMIGGVIYYIFKKNGQ